MTEQEYMRGLWQFSLDRSIRSFERMPTETLDILNRANDIMEASMRFYEAEPEVAELTEEERAALEQEPATGWTEKPAEGQA